jgi:hypothetical protein
MVGDGLRGDCVVAGWVEVTGFVHLCGRVGKDGFWVLGFLMGIIIEGVLWR